MSKRLSYLFGPVLFLLFASGSFAQSALYDNIIQINGVVMTADSLRGVPDVTVLVKNKNRGVTTSNSGVFSIVLFKGDTVQFSAVGFRPKEYVIPKDAPGHYVSMIQLMVQDTFYLPETVIKPYMSRSEFDYAFKNWHIQDDAYEVARKNTDAMTMRALSFLLPKDGRENQQQYQNQMARDAVYYGQQKPMNILNPLAWANFFEAWKRGDFRKSSNPYSQYSQ
ncbi:carboxypeptidase-like regulatory domain-containing protein [Chitinophagaceae bacterium MMS25-I14]